MRSLFLAAAPVLALGLSPAPGAAGDEPSFAPHVVRLKSGGAVAGRVVSAEGADPVVVNTFSSRNPRMTLGVERVAAADVRAIERRTDPLAEAAERLRALRGEDFAERLAIGKLYLDAKLDGLGTEQLVLAALADPESPEPRKLLGDASWRKLQRSDPRLNPALRSALDAWLAEPSAAERRKLHGALARDHSFPLSHAHLERVRRSKEQPKGRQDDRVLSLHSREIRGVYTLLVPRSYDPLVPAPLVLALHGGGAGGKDRDEVVGSGTSALGFYQSEAEKRGWLVVCPTAVEAPWQRPANTPFLLSVLEEVILLYNVDENRVWLTGHSMGGFGTWHFGPPNAHLFAAIAPMAGAGSNGFGRLRETGTGVFLYHGEDDPVVHVSDARRGAETMRKDAMDLVYVELPGAGHGLPSEVVAECFDFFDAHRLHAARDRGSRGPFAVTKGPLSSFERKVSRDEAEYLGDPTKPPKDEGSVAALLADLRKGGGSAEAAAAKLAELADRRSVAPLGALVADEREALDVRTFAAKALGGIARPEALQPLAKGLRAGLPTLVVACAESLGAIGDRKAAAPLRQALRDVEEWFRSKLTEGTRIHYSDWERACEMAGAVVAALGRLEEKAAADDVIGFPGERLLLAAYDVDASSRAGQDPKAPPRALAKILRAALPKLDPQKAEAFLAKLDARQ